MIIKIILKSSSQYSNLSKDALALSAEIGNETLSSIRLIKSFFGENYEKRDYEMAIDYAYTKGKAKAQAYGIFMALLGMISNLSILVVISYGAFLVHSDDLNVGQLISFVLYTTYIALGLSEFSGLYSDFSNAFGASIRVLEIMDHKPKILNSERQGIIPKTDCDGLVIFEHVCFHYPQRESVCVLVRVVLYSKILPTITTILQLTLTKRKTSI